MGRMKTTLDLPDDLFLKAKLLAAERRTTMKELMIQGLRHVTGTPPATEEKQRKATVRRLLKAMQATNTEPMVLLKQDEIYDR